MRPKQESTSIVLSGVEGDRHWETAINQGRARTCLMSFLYVEKKGSSWLLNRLKKHPSIKLVIDSGAHSFRTEKYCDKWPDLAWFEDYVVRYKEFILQISDVVDFVVNLDVDTPCGLGNMYRWDNEIFRPLERAGVPVCYVWHEEYGFDGWLKMCREHSFVGLPGHLEIPVYHRMLKVAIDNGCRVHGFAATKAGILGKVPFASADSISWKSGEMYGQTFVFENGSLKVYDKTQKDVRAKYKSRWVSLGVDWAGLENDEASEITKVCAVAWADYQDHVTTMTKKLAYWNKTSILVDDFLLQHGGAGAVTKEQVQEFYLTHKAPLQANSDAQARQDIAEIQAILARDDSTVFALPDDRLAYWIDALKLTPENSARVEQEATVRQGLYKFFYKVGADQALPRLSEESVLPRPDRTAEGRVEEVPDQPEVAVDLPDDPGAAMIGSTETHAVAMVETTQDVPLIAPEIIGEAPQTGHTDGGVPAAPSERKVSPDKSFVEGVEDDLLKARLGYGVDLVFSQNKLKYQANSLKVLRREQKKQKELLSRASKLSAEITAISEEAGPVLAAKMVSAGEAAYQFWLNVESEDDVSKTKESLEAKARALTPQARLLVERPDIASAIGKLGGAPKGNQNARKHGVYSAKLPQQACDNCPHIQVCPQYRAGHVCAFLTEFSKVQEEVAASDNPTLHHLSDLLQTQMVRLRRALMFETFEGGITNKEVTKLMKSVQDLAVQIHNIKNPSNLPRSPYPTAAPAAPGEKKTSLMDLFLQNPAKDAEFKKNGEAT